MPQEVDFELSVQRASSALLGKKKGDPVVHRGGEKGSTEAWWLQELHSEHHSPGVRKRCGRLWDVSAVQAGQAVHSQCLCLALLSWAQKTVACYPGSRTHPKSHGGPDPDTAGPLSSRTRAQWPIEAEQRAAHGLWLGSVGCLSRGMGSLATSLRLLREKYTGDPGG